MNNFMNNKNFTNNKRVNLLILLPNLLYVEEMRTALVFRKSFGSRSLFFSEAKKKIETQNRACGERKMNYVICKAPASMSILLTFIDFQ